MESSQNLCSPSPTQWKPTIEECQQDLKRAELVVARAEFQMKEAIFNLDDAKCFRESVLKRMGEAIKK